MSWKHHKSKEKHIIGANKLITQDITVQNLVKSQGIYSNSFDGSGVLQSDTLDTDDVSEYKVMSSKTLMSFLRNQTLPSFGSDPCGHWFRTIEEGEVKGNVIFPSKDYTDPGNTTKGWKIGAYDDEYQNVKNGSGILEFISNVSFGGDMYVNGGLESEDASFVNIGSLGNYALQIVTDASFQDNVEIANSLFVTEGDVSMNQYLFVGRDVSINNDLFVNGDVSINTLLRVPYASVDKIGSLNENKSLQIVTDASFQDNVEIGDDLTVNGDVSINNDLFVNDDVSINNFLFVNGDVSINTLIRVPHASFDKIGSLSNNELQIVTDASFQGMVEIANDLTVTHGDVSFNKLIRVPDASFDKIGSLSNNELQIVPDVSFEGMVEISNNLTVAGGDVSLNNNLFVGQDVSINNYLFVNGDVSINTFLRVPDASFNNIGSIYDNVSLQIVPDVSFQYNVDINKNLHIKDKFTVDGSFTVTSFIKTNNFENTLNKLIVSTIMEISNNGTGHALKVTQYGDNADNDVALFSYGNDSSAVEILHNGKTIFYKDVSFLENVDISNKLFVKNDVSINNNLFVNNDISVNNNIFVSSDISINNDLFVNKDISVNNNIFVGQDVSINNKLFVKRDVSINKLLTVPDVSFNNIGSLNENSLQIVTDASFQGMVEISNNLTVAGGDVSFNYNLFVGNDVSINNCLFVNLDVSINTQLTVPDASFNRIAPIDERLTVMGDLSVNGEIFISELSTGLATESSYKKIFDDISSNNSNVYSAIPWISSKEIEINRRLKPHVVVTSITHPYNSNSTAQYFVVDYNLWENNIASYGDGGTVSNLYVYTSGLTLKYNNITLKTFGGSTDYPIPHGRKDSGSAGGDWAVGDIISTHSDITKSSILLHNIKASAYVSDNSANEPLIWQPSGHNWILSRKVASDGTAAAEFHTFNQIFNTIDKSEEINYSFTEILDSNVSYNEWRVDFSGNGARNNLEENKLTWDIIVFNL